MLYLVGFVLFLIALLWLFQVVWLDEFYRWDRERQLRSAAGMVSGNMDSEQVDQLISHLAERLDMCIMVVDEQGRMLHTSANDRDCVIHRMSAWELASRCKAAPADGKIATELFNMPPVQTMPFFPGQFREPVPDFLQEERQSLMCIRRVVWGDGAVGYLLLNTIITPLDATVDTLRLQLMAVTCVVLLGAVLLAWWISRRVAGPIILVNAAARDLSRAKYMPPQDQGAYREIAELNATLTRAADELSQVERLQQELIANISHDLRTPLTMIGGYAEVMRDIPGEATPENFQIVIDETNRLTSLVSELLDFSRLQNGNADMALADFCLTDAVRAIVQRVAKLTEADGYTVDFAPEGDVWVHADEKRIGQVVYNLLGNALTYTGDDKAVTMTQTVTGGTVRIAIRDTGKGIEPVELPRIWHRYYRARESHKRAVIGSGLGLSIVESILMKHGAKYGVDSIRIEADARNHGTTFWFELDTVAAPADNTKFRINAAIRTPYFSP